LRNDVLDITRMETSEKKPNLFERVIEWVKHPEYFFWGALLLCASVLYNPSPSALREEKQAVAGGTAAFAYRDPYIDVTLEARTAYVFDAKTGEALFERGATTTNPLASIAKVMTAAVALSLVPETTLIPVTSDAIMEEGDSGLQVGEQLVLRDLVAFMLVKSSNDAARAISTAVGSYALGTEDENAGRAYFIWRMNERAKEWGLGDTSFRNESGLDISPVEGEPPTIPGAISTAKDAARLLGYALEHHPSVFRLTRWSELLVEDEGGATKTARNTNTETDKLPLLLASKTGFTDLAGGNLVIAFDAGFDHPVVVAVLGSSVDGRFTDVQALVWATLDALGQK